MCEYVNKWMPTIMNNRLFKQFSNKTLLYRPIYKIKLTITFLCDKILKLSLQFIQSVANTGITRCFFITLCKVNKAVTHHLRPAVIQHNTTALTAALTTESAALARCALGFRRRAATHATVAKLKVISLSAIRLRLAASSVAETANHPIRLVSCPFGLVCEH